MAARKKAKAKSKSKSKPKKRATGKRKASKRVIKRPKRAEATAPLAEMDAAWQSLLETALERHRAESSSASGRSRTAKKK
jgi:hypothetical protein